MAAANFEKCLAFTLAHEGGYVNDPHDPGGETNLGISKRAYPGENIKAMTRERAAQIYRRDYWDAVRGDDLPAGLDLVAFDAAVHSGPARSARWLQKAVGAKADGRIGPETIAAARGSDKALAVSTALAARLAFLKALGTWPRYKNGFTARIQKLTTTAQAMVNSVPVADAVPETPKPVAASGGFIAHILSMLSEPKK